MAFNKFMHPRNIYKDKPPNFMELANKYERFRDHCTVDELSGQVCVDFKNPEAVRSLTWALLKNDFNLDVELPKDCLVPRIPGRLNYILWLEDLIIENTRPEERELIWGVDIGAGASCVYGLLGVRVCNWHFLATDKDTSAVECARRNAVNNGLDANISVLQVDEDTALCGAVDQFEERQFHFCMCNPPFFDSSGEERGRTRANPRRPPHSATVARQNEISAEGGEVGFVSRIIEDSAKLKTKVKICTSMLGKKCSLVPLKAKLREMKACDMTETTFYQGKTQRWAIAWTFDRNIHFPVDRSKPEKKRHPGGVEFTPNSLTPCTVEQASRWLNDTMKTLKINVKKEKKCGLECSAFTDTWSHKRRKRRAMHKLEHELATKQPRREGVVDIGVSVQMGSGDGSDSLSTAPCPTECVWSSSSNAVRRTVSVQTNMAGGSPVKPLVKFRVQLNAVDRSVWATFEFVDGTSRDSLNQIVQYCRNSLHNAASSSDR